MKTELEKFKNISITWCLWHCD